MNHLLHGITWHQYLAAAFIIAVIYYLSILLRCYQPELQNLRKRFTGERSVQPLQALLYRTAGEELPAQPNGPVAEQPETAQHISETDILAGKLRAVITRAADKPFAPAILIPQLKQILQEHPHIAADQRPQLSHLIVLECEKTGTALLTEEEVDQWWER